MGKGKLNTGKIPKGLLLGVAAGIGIIILGAMITAALINMEKIEITDVGYITVATLLIAAFVASVLSTAGIKGKRILWALLTGTCLLAALLFCNVLLFGGRLNGVWVTALVIIAGSIAAALVGSGSGRRKKFSFPK